MKNIALRMILLGVVLAAGIFILTEFVSDDAEASQPIATINLDVTEQEAKVGPGQTGIVRFPGTVSADMIGPGQNVQLIVVRLQADCGWATTISPTTLYFTSAETGSLKTFEAVVRVPNFTSFQTQGQLTVSGTVQTIPGSPVLYNIQPTDGIITIQPYYMVTVSCDEPYIEINPGDPLVFNLKIKNDGNAQERMKIEIPNLDKLAEEDWVVSTGARTIMLEEGKEDIVKISVTSPQDWTLYRNRVSKVDIKVTAETSTEEGLSPEIQEYSLFIRDKGIYIPGFEPLFAILALVCVVAVFRRKRE